MSDNNSIYSKPVTFSVIALVAILVGSIVTAFYPLARDEMHPKLDTLKQYTALELAGRDIYQREGCSVCHTQTVRPLKTDVLRYGDYSKAGENAYERPFLWGSRRVGPDLARIGGKYSDEWHNQHFLDPRKFAAKSNMPVYPWLENVNLNPTTVESHMKALNFSYTMDEIVALSDKTELEALTAYMQFIGTSVDKFSLVVFSEDDYAEYNNIVKGKPEAAVRGKSVYLSECSGCHGKRGEGDLAMPLAEYGEDMDEMTAFMTIANGLDGFMPGFINTMTKDQIAGIVEYLRVMSAGAGSGTVQ
ncbi:MAG: cbb3-type cytochrome c oxidase subunit II [Deferribacteraceae bacterium]|jgi:cytochrome c oxidase cbb3-type subunit 2|nr:cbb3-type cytochrome c oxidase subunit II [Deferribacteraceae bacterium]